MRTIALKVKSYAGSVNIVNNNNISRRLLHSFLMCFGALALVYVLLLGNVVFNIVERKSMEAQSSKLANEVGTLELNYLSMSNKIDLAYSHSLGFTETVANFATRRPLGSIAVTKNEI